MNGGKRRCACRRKMSGLLTVEHLLGEAHGPPEGDTRHIVQPAFYIYEGDPRLNQAWATGGGGTGVFLPFASPGGSGSLNER